MFFGVFKEKEVIDNNQPTNNNSDLLEDFGNALDNPSKNDVDLIPLTSFNSSYPENVILKGQQNNQMQTPPNNNYTNMMPNMGMYNNQINYQQMYRNNGYPNQFNYPNMYQQGPNNQMNVQTNNINQVSKSIEEPKKENVELTKTENSNNMINNKNNYNNLNQLNNTYNTQPQNNMNIPRPNFNYPNMMPNMGMYNNQMYYQTHPMNHQQIDNNAQSKLIGQSKTSSVNPQNQTWDQYVTSLSNDVNDRQVPLSDSPQTTNQAEIPIVIKEEKISTPVQFDNTPKELEPLVSKSVVNEINELEPTNIIESQEITPIEQTISKEEIKQEIPSFEDNDEIIEMLDEEKTEENEVIEETHPVELEDKEEILVSEPTNVINTIPEDGVDNKNLDVSEENKIDNTMPILEPQTFEAPRSIITPIQPIFYQNQDIQMPDNMNYDNEINAQMPYNPYAAPEIPVYTEVVQPKEEFQIKEQVDVPDGYKVCPKCGQVMRDDYKLCFVCGTYF